MVAPAGNKVAKVSNVPLSPSLMLRVAEDPPIVTVKLPPPLLVVAPEIKVG
jgi:hypothetical protein